MHKALSTCTVQPPTVYLNFNYPNTLIIQTLARPHVEMHISCIKNNKWFTTTTTTTTTTTIIIIIIHVGHRQWGASAVACVTKGAPSAFVELVHMRTGQLCVHVCLDVLSKSGSSEKMTPHVLMLGWHRWLLARLHLLPLSPPGVIFSLQWSLACIGHRILLCAPQLHATNSNSRGRAHWQNFLVITHCRIFRDSYPSTCPQSS